MTEYTRKIKGGLSEARPATSEIQEIADKVSPCISAKRLIPNQTFII
jgi:cystatin-A/B